MVEETKRASFITATHEKDKMGAFVRNPSLFRNWISSEPDAQFPPAKGRYHLYVSYSCPWAHRTIILRNLKGLQDVIGMSIVAPTWEKTKPHDPKDFHAGWVFRPHDDKPHPNPAGIGNFGAQDSVPDQLYNKSTIRQLYEMAGDTRGKFSVPILWDGLKHTIVSNESAQIIKMLNRDFNEFADYPDIDLSPQELSATIHEVDEWVYKYINNGVYRCGFSGNQEAYDQACDCLFEYLEKAESHLSTRRFLCGDRITLSDIKLFTTLVRFDQVYVTYFKCDKKKISEFPNLMNYCRDLYQTPGIKESVNMQHIKVHYFTSHPNLNFYAIIPRGPDFEGNMKKDHDRDDKFPLRKNKFGI